MYKNFVNLNYGKANHNYSKKKSILVKQILKGLGVTIETDAKSDSTSYKQKLTKISNWSEQDVKVFRETKKAFDNFNAQEW